MFYFMLPGEKLTEEEARHVVECLASALDDDSPTRWSHDRQHWSMHSLSFLRQLDWQQHRLPDLRRFLERGPGSKLLSLRLGRKVTRPFVSRASVSLTFPEGYHR